MIFILTITFIIGTTLLALGAANALRPKGGGSESNTLSTTKAPQGGKTHG